MTYMLRNGLGIYTNVGGCGIVPIGVHLSCTEASACRRFGSAETTG